MARRMVVGAGQAKNPARHTPVQTNKSRNQLMAMELVSLEKIEFTAGIRLGGRNPATTITIVARMRAYSIMSCPDLSSHSWRINVLIIRSFRLNPIISWITAFSKYRNTLRRRHRVS